MEHIKLEQNINLCLQNKAIMTMSFGEEHNFTQEYRMLQSRLCIITQCAKIAIHVGHMITNVSMIKYQASQEKD